MLRHFFSPRLFLLTCASLLALASCRSERGDEPRPERLLPDSTGIRMEAELGDRALYQLSPLHLRAAGEAITDPAAVTWFVNGQEVGQGETYTFAQPLPGTYEVELRYPRAPQTTAEAPRRGLLRTYTVLPRFEQGVFLLNEGNFGNETGTLTYIDASQQFVLDSAYQRVNAGHKLGNVCQDMAFAGDKIYILSQNGAKNGGEGLLTIARAGSLQRLKVLNDEALQQLTPTHLAVLRDSIYVRTGQGIYVGTEEGNFQPIAGTKDALMMRLVTRGGRVYALSGTNDILVIQGTQVIATYHLPVGTLSTLIPAQDGQLWIAYTNPNTLAKLDSDPRSLRLLEQYAVEQDLNVRGDGWLKTSAPILWEQGDKLLFTTLGREVYALDRATRAVTKVLDFAQVEGGAPMAQYYNSFGADPQGSLYYAGLEGWASYKTNNRTFVASATSGSLLFARAGVNSFPAGFYPIPSAK